MCSSVLRGILFTGLLAGIFTQSCALAAETPTAFDQDIRPLLETYCYKCHGKELQKGDVDLMTFASADSLLKDRKLWLNVLQQLKDEEMPPKKPLPSAAERQRLIAWVDNAVNHADWSKIKNPGHVTIPRLTKEEYNHTLRDLLGVDLRPGDLFSEDGEGQSGFNNDRDGLFFTAAMAEKYFDAADRAFDALISLKGKPVEYHFESEKMFMTETREKPVEVGDFVGYVLNRGQMTLYESVKFPHDGYYTFTVRARSTAGPTGARLRINDNVMGDILVPTMVPALYTITCFVPRGSHQMAWNIQQPRTPGDDAPPGRQKNAGKGKAAAKALPPDGSQIVNQAAPVNAPRYPVTGNESAEAKRLVARLDGAATAVQRPYEWLRLLGPNGDAQEISRFRSYVVDRSRNLAAAEKELAETLGISPEELEKLYQQANAARFADNEKLMKATEAAGSLPPQRPGNVGIDWIEVKGPLLPAGASVEPRVFIATPGDGLSKHAAAEEIISHFATRAFRRPVTAAEVARYLGLFDKADARGDNFENSIRLALTAVLVSPNFIYRTEFGPVDGEYRLDDYQLASRLSYFLWTSMPDETLFELAAKKRLHEPAVLREQIARMVRDPKSRAFTETFLGQWLGYASLGKSVVPDEKRFPNFTPELCDAMKGETALVFESLLREDRSLLELIDSKETFLNARLARHYGIEGVQGDELQRVALTDANRGGLLGMASVLTATSSPSRTSPVIRGKWVLQTLLGVKIPEPPANAGTLAGDAGEHQGRTLREELENHRRDPTCAACHEKIDPIGFGLENFDAIGRFRTTQAGKPIDSVGAIPGGAKFSGAAELKKYLLQNRKGEFIRQTAEKMLSFALGRKLEYFDEPAILKIVAALEAHDYKALTLVTEVVMSYPFQSQSNRPEAN